MKIWDSNIQNKNTIQVFDYFGPKFHILYNQENIWWRGLDPSRLLLFVMKNEDGYNMEYYVLRYKNYN